MKQTFSRSLFNANNVLAVVLSAVFTASAAFAQTQPNTTATTTAPSDKTVAQAAKPAADTPTGTVLEFYKAMRERRFREALMMTNLRPAVESLSAQEMEDLASDFEGMAARVPQKIETSGEQVSGASASVFVKSNDPRTGELQLEEVKMRRENNAWTILTGDAETETRAKTEGKNYFFKLRLETRHADIELTLQDVIQAQLKYSLQNNGMFTDLHTLAKERLLPNELLDPAVMGYRFNIQLSADRKRYTVNAEPSVYGKTGKLSFLLESQSEKSAGPRIRNADKNGAPYKN
jgi:hypothetical protein